MSVWSRQFKLPGVPHHGSWNISDRDESGLQYFPPPAKQKELLAFFGALNYYRSSLPKLEPSESVEEAHTARAPAQVLDPLYKLATCKIVKNK